MVCVVCVVLAVLAVLWGMVGMVVVVALCIVADKPSAAAAPTMVSAFFYSTPDTLAVVAGRGVPVALVHSVNMVCSMLVSAGMVVVVGKGGRGARRVRGIGSGAGMAALAPALPSFGSGVDTVGREVLEAPVVPVVRVGLFLPGTMGRVPGASKASKN